MEDERKSSKCETFSSKSNFYKDITKIDGYRPECKFWTNQYHFKNREKNLRGRRRIAIDVKYHLIKNTRRRIHRALKRKSKSSSTIDILVIDINTYKRWIEWQMTLEMNWSKIEIDYVKPFCMVDVTKDEELREAFSWKNTQPLLKQNHQQKGTKFNFLSYLLQCIKAYQFLKLNEERLN